MTVRFIGIDPNTGGGGSPTVWVREETADLIIQGETVDAALRAEINDTVWVPGHRPGIPAHEAVITLPLRMVPILKEACGVAERSGLC